MESQTDHATPPLDAWQNLKPQEQLVLNLYWNGIPKWKCAKIANYKGKRRSALVQTADRIIKKYESQAGREELLNQAGLTDSRWVRNVIWLERHVKAKRSLKDMNTWLKTVGEAKGILKAKDFDGDAGAQIRILVSKEGEVETEDKKASQGANLYPISISGDKS